MTEGPPRRHRTAEPLTRVWIPEDLPRRRRRRGLIWRFAPLGYLAIAAVTGYLAWPWGDDTPTRREVVRTITRTTQTPTGGVQGVTFRRQARPQPTLTTRVGRLLPLPAGGALARFEGRYVTARNVPVLDVVGDEAYWVGSSQTQRVLVHLQARRARESPAEVRRGMRVSFRGTVAQNPPSAAVIYGLTPGEGAGLLERQGYHIEVAASKLRLAARGS